MLPVLQFLAFVAVNWFSPSPLYPNPKLQICSTNIAPVGSTILLYNTRNRRGATCRVVGLVANGHGQILNVSESVRAQLGFKSATTLTAFRLIGQLQSCDHAPPPSACKAPPAACIAKVPSPAISLCL